MKKAKQVLLSLAGIFLATSAHQIDAYAKSPDSPRVSVTSFDNETYAVVASCKGWQESNQRQMLTVLEKALSEAGLKVLERRNIRSVYENEYELQNLNQKSVMKRKHFLGAQYTVTGGLTELGICEGGTGNGIQLGGIVALLGGPAADLRVGKVSVISKVTVVGKVLAVETGELLKAFTAHAELEDSSLTVGAASEGIGGIHKAKTDAPIERAINQAVADLGRQMGAYVLEIKESQPD